ncbi:unnamed protein product [marine sediment metagenome]|uniref:Uncharacterized protein n=1 Tax=marine sediment metagenome TaxID=412755 RepID=X1HSM3_9ZZZZ
MPVNCGIKIAIRNIRKFVIENAVNILSYLISLLAIIKNIRFIMPINMKKLDI